MENHKKPLYFDTFPTGAPAVTAGDGNYLGFRRVPVKKYGKPLATAMVAPMWGLQVAVRQFAPPIADDHRCYVGMV